MEKEFLLSDESVNSHNTIVKTEGISLDRFLKNPVMFYNHDTEKGVVGRWENVRKADGRLYGTPVFNTDCEAGSMLQQQVQSGFIRGASIGIDNIEYEYGPTTADRPNIIARCELVEVSVCDIPSNRNTLQLYYQDRIVDPDTHMSLMMENPAKNGGGMRMILTELGLSDEASLSTVLDTISTLRGKRSEDRLALAVKRGWVAKEEAASMSKIFRHTPDRLEAYLKVKEDLFNKEFETRFEALMKRNRGKFIRSLDPGTSYEEVRSLAIDNFPLFERFLDSMLAFRLVTDDIIPSGPTLGDRIGWTLDDYRKNAPMELRRNPALLKRLMEQNNK